MSAGVHEIIYFVPREGKTGGAFCHCGCCFTPESAKSQQTQLTCVVSHQQLNFSREGVCPTVYAALCAEGHAEGMQKLCWGQCSLLSSSGVMPQGMVPITHCNSYPWHIRGASQDQVPEVDAALQAWGCRGAWGLPLKAGLGGVV